MKQSTQGCLPMKPSFNDRSNGQTQPPRPAQRKRSLVVSARKPISRLSAGTAFPTLLTLTLTLVCVDVVAANDLTNRFLGHRRRLGSKSHWRQTYNALNGGQSMTSVIIPTINRALTKGWQKDLAEHSDEKVEMCRQVLLQCHEYGKKIKANPDQKKSLNDEFANKTRVLMHKIIFMDLFPRTRTIELFSQNHGSSFIIKGASDMYDYMVEVVGEDKAFYTEEVHLIKTDVSTFIQTIEERDYPKIPTQCQDLIWASDTFVKPPKLLKFLVDAILLQEKYGESLMTEQTGTSGRDALIELLTFYYTPKLITKGEVRIPLSQLKVIFVKDFDENSPNPHAKLSREDFQLACTLSRARAEEKRDVPKK